jgi:colanic acid biosynthesis protein WcaH
MLSNETFKDVVKNTPLISIDLILENPEGEILLGWRNNPPAKGYWCVPGGRVTKNEGFGQAFKRIVKNETGFDAELADTVFLGIFEHIYPGENFTGEPDFGTHYVVAAYRIKLESELTDLPKEQHTEYWWASLDDLLDDPNVHQNTKNYFNGYPSFTE